MFQSCSSILTAQTDGWWTLGFMGGGWRAEERNKIVQGIKRERERESTKQEGTRGCQKSG